LLSLFGPAWCLRSASFGDGICLQVLEDPRGWPLGVLRMGENRTVHTVKRKVQKKSKRHWCVAFWWCGYAPPWFQLLCFRRFSFSSRYLYTFILRVCSELIHSQVLVKPLSDTRKGPCRLWQC
jgi:hypothetical protein